MSSTGGGHTGASVPAQLERPLVHLQLGRNEMNEPDSKVARIESLFRNVNERIAESARRFAADSAHFVCECADQTCTEALAATLEEYELVRSNGTRFLLRPGHEDEEVEGVVVQCGTRPAIVEKFRDAVARVARKLNPRAGPA